MRRIGGGKIALEIEQPRPDSGDTNAKTYPRPLIRALFLLHFVQTSMTLCGMPVSKNELCIAPALLHHALLFFLEGRHGGFSESQVLLNEFWRSERHPLIQRNIREVIAGKHFKKA